MSDDKTKTDPLEDSGPVPDSDSDSSKDTEDICESRRKVLRTILVGGATVASSGIIPLPAKWTAPVVRWADPAIGPSVASAQIQTSSPTTPTTTPQIQTSSPTTPTTTPQIQTSSPTTPTTTPQVHTSSPTTPTTTPQVHTSSPTTPTTTPQVHTSSPTTPTTTVPYPADGGMIEILLLDD